MHHAAVKAFAQILTVSDSPQEVCTPAWYATVAFW